LLRFQVQAIVGNSPPLGSDSKNMDQLRVLMVVLSGPRARVAHVLIPLVVLCVQHA